MAQMPEIGAKKYAGNDPAMKQVWNYIYQLEEQLRYAFNHIGADNIEEGAVTGKHIEAETITADRLSASAGNELNINSNRAILLTAKKQNEADGAISQLRIDTDSITGRVSDAEGNISQIKQTAEGLESRVASAEGGLSEVKQTAEGLESRVTSAEGGLSEVKQTAEGLESRVTSAEGGLSEVKQTAEGLESRVASAEGGLSEVKQTAEGLESRVTNAETSITQNAEQIALRATKTEVTTAVAGVQEGVDANADAIGALETRTTKAETSITQNAEQIALRATKTEVTTAVAGVQEGVDANADAIGALETRTTKAETSITQNAEQIALRATKTEVTSAVDGIQVGGTNLFTGTRDFSGDAWINSDLWSADAEYKGFSVRVKDSTFAGLTQEITVTAGEKYVFSCYAKQYSGGETRFYCVTPGVTSIIDKDRFVVTAVSWSWRRIEIAFTVTADGVIRPRLESTIADKRLYVCGIKLEKGTKATDWSPAPEDAETRISTAETQIAQNASEISLRATKTEVEGGRNYLPALSKEDGAISPYVTSQYDGSNGTYILTATGGAGSFAQIYKSGIACRALAGKKCLFHAEAISRNREALEPRAYVNFVDASGAYVASKCLTVGALSVAVDVPESAVTMQYIIRLDQNRAQAAGDIAGFRGLKLEVGTTATDWSPSPEDPARSVKTSSVTVNAEGIYLDSTGEISLAAGGKINIQSGADEGNQILLGDLFSATDQGGVTGKTANFGSLLVGGNPAAALGGNIVVASAQPSGNGILWLKPNSVATVQYQRATPSTRSWWLNGTRTIESIAAKTTDVLPGGTIHYKLTLPLYALSRLNGVVVAPKLTKSGISGEVALTAQTISILGLNVLTLEGESAINLGAAPGTPITLSLTVTNGDSQKLFVQSDTTIQLEISNRTVASGGVQALEAYWIP